jgi:hypothetical protein
MWKKKVERVEKMWSKITRIPLVKKLLKKKFHIFFPHVFGWEK